MNAELTQKLVSDYKVLVADVEELVRATASQSAEKVAAARARAQQALVELKPRIASAEAAVRDAAGRAIDSADDYVQRNPWPAIGVAAGCGLLLGLLIGRR